MASGEFDVELFERRLQSLKDSQESIQGLSSWCLERRQHHKKIVATWLQVLKKVKVEHRLTLFYLANDVIQYSKRKNFEFVESWGTTLQRATTMVRDEKVKHRILRIFKIWDQRQVYDEEFLADLSGLISAAPKKKVEPQPCVPSDEFQAALLISTMRSCSTLEQATDARLRDLREGNVDVDNAEELCASLKDRRHVEDAEKEIETAVRNVENYVRALEAEIRERTQVLDLLEQADQFYETQRGEVKIVTNAYRNFGSRVKNLKKKLDELLPTLISPIPSPDVNAPSPSPDSDIDLPGEDGQSLINQSGESMMMMDIAPPSMYNSYGQDYDPMPVPAPELTPGNSTSDFTNNFSSFMGGNVDFDMRNLFNDRSVTPTNGSQRYSDTSEAMPIEVINMRPKLESTSTNEFNISSFLKTVLPTVTSHTIGGSTEIGTSGNSIGIPGLGLDVADSCVESPRITDYGHIPTTPKSTSRVHVGMTTPTASMQNLSSNSHKMIHSTPLSACQRLTGNNNVNETQRNSSNASSPYSSQNSLSNVTQIGIVDGGSLGAVQTATQATTTTTTTSANVANVNPLPPPPLPPPIFLDDDNCYNKLPPKFPTWTPANELAADDVKWDEKEFSGKNIGTSWSPDGTEKSKAQRWSETGDDRWGETGNEGAWSRVGGGGVAVAVRGGKSGDALSETPESPPIYEKSSFNTPIEYNDVDHRDPILSSATDVDHRVRPIPIPTDMHLTHRLMKAADVDHRNLISLTGSPANNASNSNEAGASISSNNSSGNNNNVWSSADQNYRRQMQQGDNVESVDMEMSDEEAEGKQKSRVLVEVRAQQQHQQQHDRDSRLAAPPGQSTLPHRGDHDMRVMALSRGGPPILQDMRNVHGAPPPPPPPMPPPGQFHRSQMPGGGEFRQVPVNEFHHEFAPNQRQNQPQQTIFLQNSQQQQQPDFHGSLQEFQVNPVQQQQQQQPPQQLPPQDFNPGLQMAHDYHDYHEPPQKPRSCVPVDFIVDPSLRGHYTDVVHLSDHQQQHRQQNMAHHRLDNSIYPRNERNPRGRVFSRLRRDPLSIQQRATTVLNRRARVSDGTSTCIGGGGGGVSGRIQQNVCSTILQPPDTCVVLDDEGRPIMRPDLEPTLPNALVSPADPKTGGSSSSLLLPVPRETDVTALRRSDDSASTCDVDNLRERISRVSPSTTTETKADIEPTDGTDTSLPSRNALIDDNARKSPSNEFHDEKFDISVVSGNSVDKSHEVITAEEQPRQLSEHLEALMNSAKTTGNNDPKRQANGNYVAHEENDGGENSVSPAKKRAILPNGPVTTLTSTCAATATITAAAVADVQQPPAVLVHDFEAHDGSLNYRPRAAAPSIATNVTAVAAGAHFVPWRGAGQHQMMRVRGGGFRGAPRAPWNDRGPRGPPLIGNFIPRGNKRGGQYRGMGFRPRGRGGGGSGW